MVKFMALFSADTKDRLGTGEEQKYFYEIDPETWKMRVTIKELIQKAEKEEDDPLESDDEETKDEGPKFNTSVLDIQILTDDENDDHRIVYFKKVSGNYTYGLEADIRTEQTIMGIVIDE